MQFDDVNRLKGAKLRYKVSLCVLLTLLELFALVIEFVDFGATRVLVVPETIVE